MGRDKAGLVVNGETLLNRQLRLLREAGATELLVITATDSKTPEALPEDVKVVSDRAPGLGPLGGIEAALDAAGAPLVLIVAVDLPAMAPDWLRRIIERSMESRGVVPSFANRYEPLAAIYPKAAISAARASLASGDLVLQRFVQAAATAGFVEVWELSEADSLVLVNWNRPEDWT